MAGWIPWEEENLPTLPGAPQHMSTLQGLVPQHMSTGSSTANALAHDSWAKDFYTASKFYMC